MLANPTLELRDGNGTLLLSNDDWQDNPEQAAEIAAAGLAPRNNLESAIAVTLPPGLSTALLAGLNCGTGIGIVEVYDRGLGGNRTARPVPGATRLRPDTYTHTDTRTNPAPCGTLPRELRWSNRSRAARGLGGDKRRRPVALVGHFTHHSRYRA